MLPGGSTSSRQAAIAESFPAADWRRVIVCAS